MPVCGLISWALKAVQKSTRRLRRTIRLNSGRRLRHTWFIGLAPRHCEFPGVFGKESRSARPVDQFQVGLLWIESDASSPSKRPQAIEKTHDASDSSD